MKQGWDEIVLEDACNVEYGTRVVKKRDGGTIYPVYGGGGATFFMDSTNRKDCLIVARFAMSEQCTRFVKGEFFLNDSGLTVQSKDTKKIIQEFLDLQFIYLNDQIYSLSRGAAQKNLNVPAFRKIILNYPKSLPEQKHIVKILDKAFVAIDKAKQNAEQNLRNAKEVFQSKLQSIFDNGKLKVENGEWEEKTIQEMTKVINGFAFPSKEFKPTNSLKSIKITNVGVKEFIKETENNLPEKYKSTLKKVKVREGDIVIALTRTIISAGLKVAVVPKSYEGALVNQRVAALVPKKEIINQRYLYNFLISDGFAKYVLAHVNTLMQPNLSITDLKNMLVPCPAIEEQKQIVKNLSALQAETKKLEKIYQQRIADAEELKKTIQQKAFRGEL